MIVISQGRKTIIDTNNFYVEKTYGGKDKKYAIMGIPNNTGSAPLVLGYYSEEKLAIEEIKKIFEAIERGDKTYIFSVEG